MAWRSTKLLASVAPHYFSLLLLEGEGARRADEGAFRCTARHRDEALTSRFVYEQV